MKIKLLSIVAISFGSLSFAQETIYNNPEEVVSYNELGQKVISTEAVRFKKTIPIRDMDHSYLEEVVEEKERMDGRGRREFDETLYKDAVQNQDQTFVDPLLQTEEPIHENRAPIMDWQGQNGSGYPPDPSGAAGENFYVQAVNTSVRVWNKDGSSAGAGSVFSLSSLWPGSSNMGDPIVMYDRHAQRWFISQFQQSPNRILIAISESTDPLGSYYAYEFTLSSFPDYPKYSIWWDGYYMTSNSNHTALAFERDAMLAGNPSAQAILLSLPSLNSFGFRSPLSADADGDLPPNGTPCYFFNLEDDGMSGVGQDQIEIYEMTCDWNTPGNSSVSSSQILPVSAFNSFFSGGWSNIAQPGTSQGLDAIMGVFMFRAQHTRWGGHNSIVLSHAVNLGSNRSGIRWYELRDANDGVWSVYQSGTYAPDAVKSRWMSSAAMDNIGHIGMAYSISDGSSTYPGLAYTGRTYWDPLGQMTFTEQVAINGTGNQTFTDRYGDYAHLALDPDGSTFWYTGEYLTGSGKRTRVFSFSIQDEAGLLNPYYENLEMLVFQNNGEVKVNVTGIYNNEDVKIDLIGLNGQVIMEKEEITPLNGEMKHSLNVTDLSEGIYFVRVGNTNFQKVERIFIKN